MLNYIFSSFFSSFFFVSVLFYSARILSSDGDFSIPTLIFVRFFDGDTTAQAQTTHYYVNDFSALVISYDYCVYVNLASFVVQAKETQRTSVSCVLAAACNHSNNGGIFLFSETKVNFTFPIPFVHLVHIET